MECSVVIPVRNEAENIPVITKQIEKVLSGSNFEIIFIDDGSTDNSIEILENLRKKYSFVQYLKRETKSKITVGKALRLGLESAKGKYIVVMDGDLSHDPKYILPMLRMLERYDVVVASRFIHGGGMVIPFTLKKKVCHFLFSFLVRLLTGITVIDFSHGFKAFKREILKSFTIDSEGFPAYTEIALKAQVLGYKVGEYPTLYGVRTKGVSKFRLSKSMWGYLLLLWWAVRQRWKGV